MRRWAEKTYYMFLHFPKSNASVDNLMGLCTVMRADRPIRALASRATAPNGVCKIPEKSHAPKPLYPLLRNFYGHILQTFLKLKSLTRY